MLPTDLPADIRDRAARVRLAIFDVDGVLTDGRLIYAADGHELKAFHVHDGLGLKRLLANHVEVAVITARHSMIVTERMAELGVAHVYQGQDDKLACYEQLAARAEARFRTKSRTPAMTCPISRSCSASDSRSPSPTRIRGCASARTGARASRAARARRAKSPT